MRSAIRSIGIIWGVLATLLFLILVITASTMAFSTESLAQELVTNRGMSEADALSSVASTVAVLFVLAFISLIAAIYSVVLAVIINREVLIKPVGLALGIVSCALGAVLPGVLYIIDAVKGHKPDPVEEEGKTEESPQK